LGLYPNGSRRNFHLYARERCDSSPQIIEIRIKIGLADLILSKSSSLSKGVEFLIENQIKKTPNNSGSMIFRILIVVFFKN